MLSVQLAASFLWVLLAGHASGTPRCRLRGYYQKAPILFSCGGSGDTELSKVRVLLHGGSSKEIVVPAGTKDFELRVQGEEPWAKPEILQIGIKAQSVRFSHSIVGDTEVYSVKIPGTTTLPVTLSIGLIVQKSNERYQAATFMLHYYYEPFSSGPQCEGGYTPIGCEHFDEDRVRAESLRLGSWMHATYNQTKMAWNALASAYTTDLVIPHYQWCPFLANIYRQMGETQDSSSHDCDALFKFITHGGRELNRQSLYRQEFDWWYQLPGIAEFDSQCCHRLHTKYGDIHTTMDFLTTITHKMHADCPCTGMWEVCKSLRDTEARSTPARAVDYYRYLSSDPNQVYDSALQRCFPIATTTATGTTTISTSTAITTAMVPTTTVTTSTTRTRRFLLPLLPNEQPAKNTTSYPFRLPDLPLATLLPVATAPRTELAPLPPIVTTPSTPKPVEPWKIAAGIAGGTAAAGLAGAVVGVLADLPPHAKTRKDPNTTASAEGVSSASTEAVAEGATVMQVPSTVGFRVGDTVDIDPGTAIHEVNIVQAFGSLVFANPLHFAHPVGAVISKALILQAQQRATVDTSKPGMPALRASVVTTSLSGRLEYNQNSSAPLGYSGSDSLGLTDGGQAVVIACACVVFVILCLLPLVALCFWRVHRKQHYSTITSVTSGHMLNSSRSLVVQKDRSTLLPLRLQDELHHPWDQQRPPMAQPNDAIPFQLPAAAWAVE